MGVASPSAAVKKAFILMGFRQLSSRADIQRTFHFAPFRFPAAVACANVVVRADAVMMKRASVV